MRTKILGKQDLIRTALIAGYILAVLMFSGLARADVSPRSVALSTLGSK